MSWILRSLRCSGVTEETLGINPRVTVFLRRLGSQLKLLRYDRGEDDGSMDLRDKPKDDEGKKDNDGFLGIFLSKLWR